MSDGRARLRRLASVVEAATGDASAGAVCAACVGPLGVSGASAMVVTEDLPTPLGWSDAVAARLEALQHTLGEGPCVDAHETGRCVSEPDLARPRRPRWVAFRPAALDAGAAALFSFPLRLGGVRLGALTLYRGTTGDLSSEQYGDAQAVADLAVTTLLSAQAGAPEGRLSPDLEALAYHSAALHQAAGMLSVQLGVGVGDAIVRLRAYAFTENRPVGDVAADVVARRLRLDG